MKMDWSNIKKGNRKQREMNALIPRLNAWPPGILHIMNRGGNEMADRDADVSIREPSASSLKLTPF